MEDLAHKNWKTEKNSVEFKFCPNQKKLKTIKRLRILKIDNPVKPLFHTENRDAKNAYEFLLKTPGGDVKIARC